MSDRLSATDLVVAIATTDDWFQAGTVTELIAHAQAHRDPVRGHRAASDGRAVELDFYDEDGRLLRPVLALDHEVLGFARCGRPAPLSVDARLRRVLAHALSYLEAHPTPVPQRALDSVPAPGDLPALVRWVRTATTVIPRAHQSGWFHNVMHALLG